MTTATLTSKRQVTIPAEVCRRLGLHAGDRIEFVAYGEGEYLVKPATDDVRSLKGMLNPPARPVSVADMAATVRRRGAKMR